MSPRLIVFDVDGTLIDSEAHILASMAGAFGAVGRAMPDRATALSVVGLSLPLALGRLVPEADAAEAARMVAAYKDSFQSIRGSGSEISPLYPGTMAMLETLSVSPGTVLGLATGKSRRGLDFLIEAHGLAPFFATRQVADDHPSKPHPSMLLAALAETGARAETSVMVGDTEYDIEMGHSAGFRTLGVAWGYHPRARIGGADAVIDSWDEMDLALAALGNGA